jgi:alkylated DNA repair dioxygenase AlkB
MCANRIVPAPELPEGFLYRPEFLTEKEEAEVLRAIESLQFEVLDFHGYIAKRRVVSYGWDYDFSTRKTSVASSSIPEFLLPIRERAAEVAELRSAEIQEALVTKYPVGAPIGWHRDAPQFETILGISLGSASRIRLKPYKNGGRIVSIELEPRSIYVLEGPARWNFQHSIPAVKELRYSITFRSLRQKRNRSAA